jgi:thioredoxin reductase (NADPH)
MKELVIIGAGPSGLSCSIYASRFQIDHLIIAKTLGGTLTEAHWIQNYPGIGEIKGAELAQKMLAHAQSYGVEILQNEVVKIAPALPASGGSPTHPNLPFELSTESGKTYQTQTLFLGLGTRVRRLEVPGEKEFLGKGVAYCAACDAPLYKGRTVAVVGGGNSAVTATLHLSEFCPQVYLINRSESLRAEPFWQEKSREHKNIKTILNTNVTEILGDDAVTAVKLDNPHQGKNELKVEGIFIEIGATPATALAKDLEAELTKNGLIKIQPDGLTTVPGVWAGGDVATAQEDLEPRQIVHAVSEGAMAALSIFKHLRGQETRI